MALTFPTPSPGLQYTSPDGVLYVYNGTLSAWVKANAVQANTTGASALTGAILTPGGNDGARPGTPTSGMLRYNNQNGTPVSMEFYNGSNWSEVNSGGSIGVWQQAIPTGTAGDTIIDIAYGNGVYVGLIYNSGFYTMVSSDGGYTWGSRTQRGTATGTGYLKSRVIFTGTSFFVAAALSGSITTYLSTNGTTWTPNGSAGTITNFPSGSTVRVAAGGTSFVVGGLYSNANERYYYSSDGINFTLSAFVGPASVPFGVQWSGGTTFLAASGDGTMNRSTNGGSTWASVAGTLPSSATSVFSGYDGTNVLWGVGATLTPPRGIYRTATGATVTQGANGVTPVGLTTTGSKTLFVVTGTGLGVSTDSGATYSSYIDPLTVFASASDGVTVVGQVNTDFFYVGLVP